MATFKSTITAKRCVRRRGTTTIWLVLGLPLMILFLCGVVEIGNQWRARVELQSALEAAALAAVKQWSDAPGNTTDSRSLSRTVGQMFAAANAISGQSVALAPNENINGDINDNLNPAGNIVLGTVALVGGELQFDASGLAGGVNAFGVRTQATVSVPRVCPSLSGGNFSVSAQAVARVATSGANPQLVRIDRYLP